MYRLAFWIPACAGMTNHRRHTRANGCPDIASGIHVAEFLTVLPPPEVLREKLHIAIETARARIEAKGDRDEG